jgi:hypothetical protein
MACGCLCLILMFKKRFRNTKNSRKFPTGIRVVQVSGIPGDLRYVLQFFVVTCGFFTLFCNNSMPINLSVVNDDVRWPADVLLLIFFRCVE